jgi:protein-tyrosine phosphatase
VEALRAGRRVLVHCAAGINRSSSVCCAALMLMEGLRPQEALARVRERHPEAHPDPYHWFALQHLPALIKSGRRERRDGADGARDLVGLGLPHALARRD